MNDEFDFANAIKNPFAGQFNNGYKFIIHNSPEDSGQDEAKIVKPEDINAEIEKDIENCMRDNEEPVANA